MRNKTSALLFFTALLAAGAYYFFVEKQALTRTGPAPTNGKNYREGQDESESSRNAREAWMELIHRAAPGTDWREMDRLAARQLAQQRSRLTALRDGRSVEIFANGNLEGEWRERGSRNQAGSLRTVEYVPALNKIFGIADGGSLWKGNPDGSGWTILNDDFLLHPEILEAFYPNDTSAVRLIGASGKTLMFSDDEGQVWNDATFTPGFYDGWGSPMSVTILPDSTHTIYYLAHTWDATPWAPRIWLYRSTDGGQNFQRLHVFDANDNDRVSMWAPAGTAQAYILDRSERLYGIAGDSLQLLHDITTLPTGGSIMLTGHRGDSTLTLYTLFDGHEVHKSADGGATWTYQGDTPTGAWGVGMICSPTDPDKLFMGAVNCSYSYDGGVTWELANEWWEYYGQPDLLHADIMDLKFFEKNDGTPFLLIANHGGLHISYDDLATSQNIGLQGMNISQYYDVLTNPDLPNFIYAGAQDQGWQWTTQGTGDGPVDFQQQWSGDYGQMLLSRNNQSLWVQYPGGVMGYYNFPATLPNPWPDSGWGLPGSDKPAAGWIVPTTNLEAFPGGNTVFIGGGNIEDGPGSYLIALSASTVPPYTIEATQYDFDFKANSNSGEGLISAIEQSVFDDDRIYVATSDGTFFHTEDGGTNWGKSTGFTGPTSSWIYTTCILSSKINPNVLWISGSGYSNPPVYRSDDGGQTFTPMSSGLPGTLVQELAANPGETLLFAATTLGPFVYVTWEDQWYSLLGEQTPLQWNTSVEYIAGEDVVRFATFGRGIWDLAVTYVAEPPVAAFEAGAKTGVKVWPNPVQRYGTLNIATAIHRPVAFTLAGLNGKIVKKAHVNQSGTLALGGVAAGVYVFYTVADAGNAMASGKVVVW